MENNQDFVEIQFKIIQEPDGTLTVAEVGELLPFLVKRFFMISDVPPDGKRGEHACKNSDFVYFCVNGSLRVLLDNGIRQEEYFLERGNRGLFVPRMTWMKIYEFSKDAVLLILASEKYETGQYYSDYASFQKAVIERGREK